MPILEICAGSFSSAKAAQAGGAQRVELCSGLDEGGLTPSPGLIRAVRKIDNLKMHVLIRPRGGDFLYSDEEKQIIIDDIHFCVDEGVDGVVVGALLADGSIDLPFLESCMEAAREVAVTFHRAFDLCSNPFEALDAIAQRGCSRILTSGLASSAEQGIDMLAALVKHAEERLTIMPGCGVNPQNAAKILRLSGAKEIHASARKSRPSRMQFRHEGVEMGKAGVDEYAIMETSAEVVQAIVQEISQV